MTLYLLLLGFLSSVGFAMWHANRASARFWAAQEAFLRALEGASTVAEVEALHPAGKALEDLASGFRAHGAGIREASTAYHIKLSTLRARS